MGVVAASNVHAHQTVRADLVAGATYMYNGAVTVFICFRNLDSQFKELFSKTYSNIVETQMDSRIKHGSIG